MPDLDKELAKILVQPLWEQMAWISLIDYFHARDCDVTDDILDEHLACAAPVTRADHDRLVYFRQTLTPAHRPQIEDALEATGRETLVELLSYTCETSKQFAAALRRAGAGKALQPAIDYALRRFVDEPPVAKKLWSRAKPYAKTAAGGKWQTSGEQAWRALFVTDTRESADAMTEMIASTWIYTNLPVKQRLCAAAAKRARLLTHGKRCAPPLVKAMVQSYTREEITQSAVALKGTAVKKQLEEKWGEYTTYNADNNPARTALGGLLAVAPTSKIYQDAAKRVLPKMLRDDLIFWDDIGLVNGLVMGIERGRIKALRPLLEKVARWKYKAPRFDSQDTARAELAAELMRRRARRALDAR